MGKHIGDLNGAKNISYNTQKISDKLMTLLTLHPEPYDLVLLICGINECFNRWMPLSDLKNKSGLALKLTCSTGLEISVIVNEKVHDTSLRSLIYSTETV